MADQPLRADRLDLVALPTAASCARLFVQYTLTGWGASFVLADALTVAGELVAGAVAATGLPDPRTRWTHLPDLALITVRLLGYRGSIVIEVWDRATEPVRLPPVAAYDHLTGLHLVDVTAHRWGSRVGSNGRVTWAELLVYPRTESGLPIRTPRPSLHLGAAVSAVDAGILRRVHNGLTCL